MEHLDDLDQKVIAHNEVPPDDDTKVFNLRNFGWLVLLLAGIIVFVVVLGALLSGFFLPGHSLLITQAPTILPPEPRLEGYATQDFKAFYATQQAALNSYGWVDRNSGSAHIPVERAMELLAQQGLPVFENTPTPLASQVP